MFSLIEKSLHLDFDSLFLEIEQKLIELLEPEDKKCTQPWNQRTHSILATTWVYLLQKVLVKRSTFVRPRFRKSAILYF